MQAYPEPKHDNLVLVLKFWRLRGSVGSGDENAENCCKGVHPETFQPNQLKPKPIKVGMADPNRTRLICRSCSDVFFFYV